MFFLRFKAKKKFIFVVHEETQSLGFRVFLSHYLFFKITWFPARFISSSECGSGDCPSPPTTTSLTPLPTTARRRRSGKREKWTRSNEDMLEERTETERTSRWKSDEEDWNQSNLWDIGAKHNLLKFTTSPRNASVDSSPLQSSLTP